MHELKCGKNFHFITHLPVLFVHTTVAVRV